MAYEIKRFPYPGTIDADGHVLEPPDLWENYLEARYRDRALRIKVDDEGYEYLEIDGRPSARSNKGSLGMPGATARAGVCGAILPLNEIGGKIRQFAAEGGTP